MSTFKRAERSTSRALTIARNVLNMMKPERKSHTKAQSEMPFPKSHVRSRSSRRTISRSTAPESLNKTDVKGKRRRSLFRRTTATSSRATEAIPCIFSLPFEILAHIFHLGTRDDIMLPITVSHVCSSWRHLALNTPALWQTVSLDWRVDMWTERMHRAQHCPLDVELSCWTRELGTVTRYRAFDFYSVQWYMQLVNPVMHRWRSLTIIFGDYAPFLWNAALSESCHRSASAPFLEEIHLTYPANDDTKEFTLFGGYAPRLKRATLEGIRLTWLPFLFRNLTVLDYSHHGFTMGKEAVDEMLNMLEVCSRLQDLRIAFSCEKVERQSEGLTIRPRSSHRVVTLARLRTLHWRIRCSDIPSELLVLHAHLYTPKLDSLHLLDLGHSRQPFLALNAFLGSMRPAACARLMALRVEGGWFHSRLIFDWVDRLPNGLREFVVQDALGRDWMFGSV